jgi:hypothetical protein
MERPVLLERPALLLVPKVQSARLVLLLVPMVLLERPAPLFVPMALQVLLVKPALLLVPTMLVERQDLVLQVRLVMLPVLTPMTNRAQVLRNQKRQVDLRTSLRH